MRGKTSISFLLAFVMFFSQVSVSFANEIKFSAKNTENSLKVHNEFIEKTANKYKDDDQVEIIVTLKDDKEELLKAMKNDYSQKKVAPYTKVASIDYKLAERVAELYEPQIKLEPGDEEGVVRTVRYNLATQKLLKFALDNKGYRFKITNHIDYIFNAIGITTDFNTAKEISKLPYVSSVDPIFVYKRADQGKYEMHTSKGIIKANDLNKTGYTGKGMIAAVLDTGLWYESGHEVRPEFKDSHLKEEDLKLKKDEAQRLITEINKEKNSQAFYINNKIPYAMDYFNKNEKEVEDYMIDKNSHGTHVSGILVANGAPEQKQIRGVAPDAQLLFMQVFNNVGGATKSSYIAEAINDAIKLKADTINMSLSLANMGDTRQGDQVLENAINKANESGVTVAVAAGNYGSSAYPQLKVRSDNFDYGTVRDLASFKNSFAVASSNNTKVHTNYITIISNNEKIPVLLTDGFSEASMNKRLDLKNLELETVDAGVGLEEDFEKLKESGIEVSGKAVIMQRKPGTTYATKVGNAKKYGAALAIVYNHDGDELQSMDVGVHSNDMPSLFIGKKSGEKIINSKSKVSLGKDVIVIDHGKPGLMSDFSSWGATIDLGFKPEITAPGEGIYSTNTNGYISMGGTSMASPHIAGSSLILKQYLKEKFPNIAQSNDISYIIKNIMMSTAKPIIDPLSQAEYSPRKQGAGLVDLEAATSTKVYAYEKKTHESKVNLYELEDGEYFDLVLKNFGNETVSYDVSLVINTDLVEENYITLRPKRISSENIGSIQVGASSTAEKRVKINIPEEIKSKLIKEMPNGFWIEGFVHFKSNNSENPDLSIPFISLRTKDNLNAGTVGVIEPLIYDLNKESNNLNIFYNEKTNDEVGRYQSWDSNGGAKVIGLEVDGTLENLKARKDKIAISPNGDGVRDHILPTYVFTRFVSRVFFGLEKDGESLIETSAMSANKVDQFKSRFQDFNLTLYINDKIKDGVYDIVTTAITDYSEAGVRDKSTDYLENEKYVIKDKLIIDRNKPRITDIDIKNNEAIVTFTDEYQEFEGSGIKFVEILGEKDGKVIKIDDRQKSITIPFNSGKNETNTKIKIEDWAGNKIEGTIQELRAKLGFKSINVVPTILNSTWKAKDFSYVIVDKSTKEEVKADELKAGAYIVAVTNLGDGLELRDERQKEIILSESDTSKTVTFSVFRPREADENKHQVSFHYLKGLNGSENIDPSLIEIVGINSVGKKYTFANDSINPLIFSNYINTGQNYDFEIRIKDENYVAVPSKFNVKVKHVDRDLSFQIYKKESPTETVDVKAKFEFEKSHAEEPNRKFAQLLIDGKELLDSQQSNRHLQGTRLEAFSENEVIFHNLPKYNQDHSEIKCVHI